jgi:hypothetical protein
VVPIPRHAEAAPYILDFLRELFPVVTDG